MRLWNTHCVLLKCPDIQLHIPMVFVNGCRLVSNVRTALQLWRFDQNLTFCEWRRWRQLSGLQLPCVDEVSDGCLTGWWRHRGGFLGPSQVGAWVAWDSLPVSVHACASSREVPPIVIQFEPKLKLATNFNETLQYKISWISIEWFSSCYVLTAQRTEG